MSREIAVRSDFRDARDHSSDFDEIVTEFGRRVDAALAQKALELARNCARVDAFMMGGPVIDSSRDQNGEWRS